MREILDELLKREDVDKRMLEDITMDRQLIEMECPDLYFDVNCNCDSCDSFENCRECWRRSLGLEV